VSGGRARAAATTFVAVVGHPPGGLGRRPDSVAAAGRALGVPVFEPEDINSAQTVRSLRALQPDVLVLAGYGPILRGSIIDMPSHGCVNLHGGRLPQYRGSSPLNWALINGETAFTISIIRVDAGVDTGDVLLDRTFPIGPDDTIADLHRIANANFPRHARRGAGRHRAGTLAAANRTRSRRPTTRSGSRTTG
jgi:methionyl-tRNA formyltransferase